MKKITLAMLACVALLTGCATNSAQDPTALNVVSALKKDQYIGKFDIKAEADDGKVTLNGAVNNDFQKYQAESIAKKVSGVKSVENKIKVN